MGSLSFLATSHFNKGLWLKNRTFFKEISLFSKMDLDTPVINRIHN